MLISRRSRCVSVHVRWHRRLLDVSQKSFLLNSDPFKCSVLYINNKTRRRALVTFVATRRLSESHEPFDKSDTHGVENRT